MTQLVLKTSISVLLMASASVLALRSILAGAVLVLLPLTSLFATIWLWRASHDAMRIAMFASDFLWLIVPFLLLFIALPLMLRSGYRFTLGLGFGVFATIVGASAVVMLRGGTA